MKRIMAMTIVVALAIAMLSVQTADAQATLVASEPPADSVIPATPDDVRVTFDTELDTELSRIEMVNATGSTIADGGVDLDDPDRASLTIDLPDDVPPGEYTVTWIVVAAEESAQTEVEGEYSFTIDPTATPTSSPTVAIAAPEGTIEPVENTDATDTDDNDGFLGRGALIVGGVSILVAVAVVATIGRRRYMR